MDLTELALIWVMLGAVEGAVTTFVARSRRGNHLLRDASVGLFGAACAGLVFYILDVPKVWNFVTWSVVAALAGGAILLFLWRLYTEFITAP